MPIRDLHTNVFEYPMPKRGVNIYKNIVDLHPEEAVYTQNCVYNNGLVKRPGSSKYSASEVSTGAKIVGLHRFYYDTASAQTLAASGTVVKYWDSAAWQNVKTGLTAGQPTYFVNWLNKCYIANGTDAPHSWDGTSSAALAAAPANTLQFLPYQDRLLSITGGDLTWSASFSTATWESVANCGVRPDSHLFGMSYHSSTNISAGYQAKVLLAGSNGMYLFSGSDLRTPFTTGNYTINPLSTSIGCNAPRTMCWTPRGTIYLGIDRMVYLLPFESSTPIPIGHKVVSHTHLAGIVGIEEIPAGQIANACAAYHDGYYKLVVATVGQTVNNIQWWLDLNRLYKDEDGFYGPWYGPMLGMTISCMTVLNGNGDSGELLGGENTAATGSFIYSLNSSGIFADVGTAIQIYYQTFYNDLGNSYLKKDVHKIEAELLDVLGSVNVDYLDINETLKAGDVFALSDSAIYWDDAYWDEQYWSSSSPTRQVVNLSPAIQPRRLSLLIKFNSSNDDFELYALRAEAIEQNVVFG